MKKILFVDIQYDYGIPARGINTIGQLGFLASLRKLGHDVVPFYYDNYLDNVSRLQSDLLAKADEVKPDLIFFIIFKEHFSFETLKKLKQKYTTVNWFGDDTWRFESFTKKYCSYFTYCITTDKFSISKYHKLGCKDIVLSQWAAIDCDFIPSKQYQYDISFVGGFNNYRNWFVKQLGKMGYKVECFGYGWSNGAVSNDRMIEIFSASKINLNLSNSASFDLRYLLSNPKNFVHSFFTKKQASQIKARNFEINCFNGFQLTDYVAGIEDYYDIGKEISCYVNVEEAALLIDYYLYNAKEREAIRQLGHLKGKNRYTYTSQLKNVLAAITPIPVQAITAIDQVGNGMKRIFIDPTYDNYGQNRLFDPDNPILNRDNSMAPFIRFRQELNEKGIDLQTFDQIEKFKSEDIRGAGYISLGKMTNIEMVTRLGLKPLAFFIMEPPLIIKKNYDHLPVLSHLFEKVFIHNTEGDKYSLKGVKTEHLHKFYWPMPYASVLPHFWKNNNREFAIVIINGHHRPKRMFSTELYSKRIEWAVGLNKHIKVDLYGKGWNKLISLSNIWLPFLLNFGEIKKIYRGSVSSKHEVMSKYEFALCLENQIMNGYITEKIFDCFYSGAIPIYRGGDDISKWIPSECFIDLRKFQSSTELANYLKNLSAEEKISFRNAGKSFLESSAGQRYFSLYNILFQSESYRS